MDKLVAWARVGNWAMMAAAVAVGVGVMGVFGRQMPPEVPLFYSRPWGESQLANPRLLGLLPVLAVGVGAVMGWMARKEPQETPLVMLMLATSMVSQAVLMLGFLRIVVLIT